MGAQMSKCALFIAGGSKDHARVRAWAERVEQSGLFVITSRWFVSASEWTGTDDERERTDQAIIADAHETAIRRSRLFWLLWPDTISFGALHELGYATAQRWHTGALRIAVSGTGCSRTIYTAKADFRDEADAVAFHTLCTWARAERATR